jgi:hypothetical protein
MSVRSLASSADDATSARISVARHPLPLADARTIASTGAAGAINNLLNSVISILGGGGSE